MSDDLEDLIGPTRPKRGAPTLEERAKRREEIDATEPDVAPLTFEQIREGVTTGWLAAAFSMDAGTVRRYLGPCPIKKRVRGNTAIYDFRTAASYLVKPKFDLKTLRSKDLPPDLQDSVWSALLKKQKWEQKAGELWRTSAVMEVFGRVFLLIKNTMQLWTEDERLSKTLTDEQRAALIEMVDGLQKSIYEALIEDSKANMTRSQLAELDAEDNTTIEDLV